MDVGDILMLSHIEITLRNQLQNMRTVTFCVISISRGHLMDALCFGIACNVIAESNSYVETVVIYQSCSNYVLITGEV